MQNKLNPSSDDLYHISMLLHANVIETITLVFDTTPNLAVVAYIQRLTETFPNSVNVMLKGNLTDYSFLKELPQLAGLSLFMFGEFEFDYLNAFSNLKRLRISQFTNKGISLKSYKDSLSHLETLIVSNTIKEGDFWIHLNQLSSLFVSKNHFNFMNIDQLPFLKKLGVFGGAISNFNHFCVDNFTIQYLSLSDIKNIDNLECVTKLHGLEFLELYNLKKINRLPSFEHNKNIRRISIERVVFDNLEQLLTAQNLEEICIKNLKKSNQELNFLLTMEHLKMAYLTYCPDDLCHKLKAKGVSVNNLDHFISDYMNDLQIMHDL